ncbi:formate dehydrogenase accessory protein FdhE [Anaerobacillus sp. CMMVII]|uniref:formate dehydrogenase accessory protein FdhE n=1 Tax=Anaerobacillus sp. CMMVII TaxID=2755588 RepID=UPI0021B73F9E|nr:formate dehydrogenase accessory protein FdhE [Anaerobacillus sp. CMMVII]MCT8137227.1 formate dehydrogenase accessory protein FdhE [Anaerobacillus sp. CMMVII]
MKSTVISEEYLALQTDISNKQTKWTESLDKSSVVEKQPLQHKHVPIIAQTMVNVNYDLYKEWIFDLADYLVEKDEKLQNDVTKLKEILNDEIVKKWVTEVLAFNQIYFHSFAEKEGLAEWFPYFLAEHSLRPYLRVVSDVYKDELATVHTKGSCPCCGEPIRLAVLEGKGLKMIVCPRCEAKWNQKRLHCSLCGNEDHESLSYYNIEEEKNSKLEVCGKCNGYIKIIDTRKLFKKQTAFLLDLTTLHLDFVAQENGFGITEEEEVKS